MNQNEIFFDIIKHSKSNNKNIQYHNILTNLIGNFCSKTQTTVIN